MKLRALKYRCNLEALLAIILALWPLATASGNDGKDLKRKFFIQDISIGPGITIQPNQLLMRVQEQLPWDVLSKRHLVYDDPSVYLDVQKWNPLNRSDLRKPDNILQRLYEMKMKYMLTFSLSRISADSNRLLLSGRLVDLDRLNCMLVETTGSAHAESAESDDERPCSNDENVFENAVISASVELGGFDEFRLALETVFARLFNIPEIRFDETAPFNLDMWPSIWANFRIEPNRIGRQRKGVGVSTDLTDDYNFTPRILRLPTEMANGICSSPERYMGKLLCFKGRCFLGTDEVFDEKVDKASHVLAYTTGANVSFAAARFHPGQYRADYLFSAILTEREAAIESAPVYRCISVRAPKLQIGLAFRFSFDFNFHHSDSHPTLWGNPGIPLGVDILFTKEFSLRQTQLLPYWGVSGILGITNISSLAVVRCPVPGVNCLTAESDESIGIQERSSSSTTLELRSRLFLKFFQNSIFSSMLLTDFGIGAERLYSDPTHGSDGWYGQLLLGIGGSIGLQFSSGAKIYIATLLQLRNRLASPPQVSDNWADSALVPNGHAVIWAQLIVEWAVGSTYLVR